MRLPFAIIFAVFGYWTLTTLQMDHFADDPGVSWHLLTGWSILQTGDIPRVDPFLAAPTPRPWVADQWLSDVFLAGVFNLGGLERGMPFLYAALTTVFLLTFMGLTFAAAYAHSRSPLLSGVAALVALKLSTIHFILRPVILGFFLFALVTVIIWEIVRKVRSDTPVTIRDVAILLPLTALWANIHPSFGLGVIVFGLMTVGLLYDTVIIARRPFNRRLFALLGGTLTMMAVATLLNPYGYKLLQQVFGLVSDDFFMSLNSEWKPLNPWSGEGQLFLFVIVALTLGAFLAPRRSHSIYFTELLVIGFLALSTLKSVRFMPYFALAAAPLLAVALRHLLAFEPLSRLPLFQRLGTHIAALDNNQRITLRAYSGLLALLALFPLADAARNGTVSPYRGPFGPSRDRFPFDGATALVEMIDRENPSAPLAVAATPDWGGFLALSGIGRWKPVLDDRNSLLGAAPYQDYLASTTIGGDINGYLERVGARFLILKTNEPLAIYLRDTGKLRERWRGPVSTIFESGARPPVSEG